MKIDNFTTARCDKCYWVKQFKPGIQYDSKEFICNCKANKKDDPALTKDVIIELDSLKEQATSMGISFRSNIGIKKLQEKINGATDGAVSSKANKKNTES